MRGKKDWLGALVCLALAACDAAEPEPVFDAGTGERDAGQPDAGVACDSWSAPDGGATIVQGRRWPFAIAVDDAFVYWIEGHPRVHGGSAIARAPKTGGAAEVLVQELDHPLELAATTRELVWNEIGVEEDGFDGRIVARTKDGGRTRTIAQGLSFPWALAADDRAVFWTTENRATKELELWTLEADAPAPRRVLTVADTAGLSSIPNSRLHLTEQSVLWAIGGRPGDVLRGAAVPGVLEIARGAPETATALVSGRSVEIAVATADALYFAARGEGLFHAARGSDAPPRLIAQPQFWSFDLALDARDLYWLELGRVHRTALADPVEPVLLVQAPALQRMFIDGDSLYFTAQGSVRGEGTRSNQPCGAIQRLPIR